jgi:hypothetical protein
VRQPQEQFMQGKNSLADKGERAAGNGSGSPKASTT